MMNKVKRKIKKVMLVTPPYHCGVLESAGKWLPLGFAYIAGSLREAGFETIIYDAMTKYHELKDIKKRIAEEKPDVVATGCYTSTYPAGLQVLKAAREIDSSIVTVMGGVHPTFMFEEVLNENPEVDYVVRGEGEITFKELLLALNSEEDLEKVAGIAFKKEGIIVATRPREFVKNLDVLNPAWDLLDWEDYIYFASDNKRVAIVSTSRGCIYGCSFCSQQLFWKKKWRAREPLSVAKELELLRDKFGVEVVMFSDEYPTFDRQRWVELLNLLIEREVGMEILMETRVDDVVRDEDIMNLYKKAGISHIYVGVESVNQKNLDIFKKNVRVEQSKKALEIINEADIISETSVVVGMPDETKESIQFTLDLVKHYDPDMAFFLPIAPWPYADVYQELKPYIITQDYSKYNLVTPVVKPVHMSIKELEEEINHCYMDFYMGKMRKMNSLSPFKRNYMKNVFRILRHSCLGDLIRKIKIPEEMKALMHTPN
jgi:anaerobic magnesium-protoporphyrin IX monomethyl ester cyclase